MADEERTRVFLIGGITGESGEDPRKMRDACRRLGDRFGSKPGYQIVVCSAHDSSADASVLEGFANTRENESGHVIIHRPLDSRPGLGPGESIRDQWETLIRTTGLAQPQIRENSEARVSAPAGFANAFLLCQIRALKEDTDVVVAVGGKRGASAAQLLAIARDNYPIVPFAFFGGAGEQEFVRQESALRASVGDSLLVDALQSRDGVERVLDLVDKFRRAHGRHHVFLSYAWKRAPDADYVEAFLRRDPKISLFRDEDDIRSGEPISERIRKKLDRCDVFLALWSAEYAASSNCYDELRIASSRKDCLLYILRLDDTRPVWPLLRKPRSHDWKDKWDLAIGRDGIAARLSELLRML